MSTKNNTQPAEISAHINISKEDVLAVAIAEFELKIMDEVKDLGNKIQEISSKIESDDFEYHKKRLQLVNSLAHEEWGDIIDALDGVGVPYRVAMESGYTTDSRTELYLNVNRNVYKTVPAPAVNKLREEHEDNISTLTKKRKDLGIQKANLSARLRDIPAFERQAKAGLARESLKSSKEGVDMLKRMDQVRKGLEQRFLN